MRNDGWWQLWVQWWQQKSNSGDESDGREDDDENCDKDSDHFLSVMTGTFLIGMQTGSRTGASTLWLIYVTFIIVAGDKKGKKITKVRRCDLICHDREDAPGVEVSENSQVVSSHHSSSSLSRLWTHWAETVTITFPFLIKSAIGHRLSATSGLFTEVMSIKRHRKS